MIIEEEMKGVEHEESSTEVVMVENEELGSEAL